MADFEVVFVDEQSPGEGDVEHVDADRLRRLAHHVLGAERVPAGTELAIMAVGAATIAAHNARFLNRGGATDVLAFPVEGVDDAVADMPLLLGDVVICPAVARANSESRQTDLAAELDLLCVHGILHLLGYDHMIDAEADEMEARELELLAEFRDLTGRPR